MSDDINRIDQRLRTIENDLITERAARAAHRKWIIAAGAAMLTWLGITSFYQIPKAVEQSNTGQVAHEAEAARDRAVKAAQTISDLAADPLVRVEQGLIPVPASPGRPIRDGAFAHRTENGFVRFSAPYKELVMVHCVLRNTDITGPTRYIIKTEIRQDRSGFDWTFETWADTHFFKCELDYLAIGK